MFETRLYHVITLIHTDLSASIHVVHLECPFELVCRSLLSLAQADCRHELTEIQPGVTVSIKTTEDTVRKLKYKLIAWCS